MKVHSYPSEVLADSGESLTAGVADYVYMYPPRQAYRPLSCDPSAQISRSLASRQRVNLYLHVPFCRQLCHFCNLYTTTPGATSHAVHDRYVQQLIAELESYRSDIDGLEASTIYIGGGTPSLLAPELIRRIVDATLNSPVKVNLDICEIAIEVAPEHIDAESLLALRDAGVNRVNLGIQSTSAREVKAFGRRRKPGEDVERLRDAVNVGFRNVCADLIYGLDGQTDASWEASLQEVVAVRPATICCYALTRRPLTGYARGGAAGNGHLQILRRYDIAATLLRLAGYKQETHVRWSVDGGGYLQKQYHWAMENVLGIGAGARSYLWDVDLRNGYSIVNRQEVLNRYLDHDFKAGRIHTDGFEMTDDERRRKFIVLGLGHLDLQRYQNYFASSPLDDFPGILELLERRSLIKISNSQIELTPSGWRHRDPIVQLFFSEEVRTRLRQFTYVE